MEGALTVDTNVVVRFLVKDDPRQCARARQLIDSETVFVPDTVFMETEWVLRAAYGFKPQEIEDAFRRLLRLRSIQVADRARLATVLDFFSAGLDFADALHYALGGSREVKTFDQKFVRRGRREGLAVSSP